jgi:hypothetical protein
MGSCHVRTRVVVSTSMTRPAALPGMSAGRFVPARAYSGMNLGCRTRRPSVTGSAVMDSTTPVRS